MASMSISLRKMSNSTLFSKLHNPAIRSFSFIPSVFHSFNTKSVLINNNDNKKVQSRPISHFPDGCSSEVPIEKTIFRVGSRGRVGEGWKKSGTGFGIREDEEAIYFRYEMPGFSKGDVKVTLENETLFVNGDRYDEMVEASRKCGARLKLPSSFFKLDSIQANMENGILMIVVSKADC